MTIPPNRITAFPLKDDLQWYDPEVIFRPFDDLFGRGVAGTTDLQVIANAGPDGQISVKAGRGYVPYTSGGKRLFSTGVDIRSDDPEFLTAIPAWAGGNPRVHRIIAKILDATLTPGDVLKGGVFDILLGAATSGATLVNLSGAQAVPSNALLLGNVLQSGTTIPTGNIDSTIGTVRARARIGAGNAPSRGVEVGGAPLTDRQFLNLIAGTGIGIAAVDNAGADSADVTITNTLPAPVMPMVELFDYTVAGSVKASIDTFVDNANTPFSGAYSTLVVRGRVQGSTSAIDTALNLQLNNDTTADYDNAFYYIDSGGSLVVMNNSTGQTNFQIMRMNAANVSTGWAAFRMEIFNYASSVSRMGVIFEGTDSGSGTRRWFGSGNFHGAPITRMLFAPGAGQFAIGSRIQVYGIR